MDWRTALDSAERNDLGQRWIQAKAEGRTYLVVEDAAGRLQIQVSGTRDGRAWRRPLVAPPEHLKWEPLWIDL